MLNIYFLQLLLYVTIAFHHEHISSGGSQNSSTLTTTLSSWWIGSGGQVTVHLLMASSFLPLSYSISSMKLTQPPLPSYEQRVPCSSRPCLKLTSAAILIGQESLYSLFPQETAMPAILCLYTPELKADASRPSSREQVLVNFPLNAFHNCFRELIDCEEPKKPGQKAILVQPGFQFSRESRPIDLLQPLFCFPQRQCLQHWHHLSVMY